MKRITAGLMMLALAGCTTSMSPEVLSQYQSRTLYTCCNIHHEGTDINDANYYVGTMIPLGSPVRVEAAGRSGVTISVDGQRLNLYHSYGTQQESFQQYLDKILVPDDPQAKVATYPQSAQAAIKDGRVEVGMTREQVLLSLGYPPTHRTASTSANEWTYWYNRYVTYRVQFDDSGRVSGFVGTNVPTRNQPIKEDPKPVAKPAAKPAKKKGR
jgi:outer membrane protein assembly factor BamE (lipoprotein component of BamABCDE complex)